MEQPTASPAVPIINPLIREYRLALVSGLTLIVLIGLPFVIDNGTQLKFSEFFTFAALAIFWNLLAGFTGLVSVGQQAWIGLGSYATIVIADDFGISLFAAVFIAGIVTGLLSIPTAFFAFRLRAGYFAIGTWVIAEVFRLLIKSSTDWLGGGAGRSISSIADFVRATSRDQFQVSIYYVSAGIAVGAVIVVYTLMRSRIGLGLTATRDSESGAQSLGVDTYRLKLLAFIIAAAGTGIVGGIIAVTKINVRPDAAFSVQWTAYMIFITVIGGIGTIEGPIIGAIIFYLIRENLSDFGEWSFIILGVVAVVMMLIAPRGVWGLIQARTDFELFPIRRLMPMRLLIGQKGDAK